MQVLGLCPSTSPSTPFPPPSFSSTAPRVRAQQRYSWVQVFSSRFQDRVSFRLSSRRNLWIISTVAGSAAIFFFFFPFLFFLGYVSLSCVRGMRDRAEEVDGGEGVRDAERERERSGGERKRRRGGKRVMGTAALWFWMLPRGGEEAKRGESGGRWAFAAGTRVTDK